MSRIPFGYDKVGFDFYPDEEALKHLDAAIQMVNDEGMTLRQATDYLVIETQRPMSHEGLRRIIKNYNDGKGLPSITRRKVPENLMSVEA